VNLSDLVVETYKIIKENDLPRDKMSATYLYYIVQALRNTNRRLYCGSGLSTLFLDSNGDLYPCMNTLYQEAFKCGNIREVPFGQIWECSPVYHQMRCLNIPESNKKCMNCEVRYICAGYCRGVTYAATGDVSAPFIWCEDFKKTLINTMWILAEEPDLFKKQAAAEFTRYGMW
jgi:radical SAM protein with 4Fe4S-binding SPASM domain